MKNLVIILITALLFAACSNTSRVKSAKTMLIVGESVHAAMNVYRELYLAGDLTDEQIRKVREKHKDFQALFGEAAYAVSNDLSSLSPLELSLMASSLIFTIESL